MSLSDELREMFERAKEPAAGGVIRSRSLADALRDAGWKFEVRPNPGSYPDPELVVWPPHLADRTHPERRPLERVTSDLPDLPREPRRDVALAERLRAEALELERFAPTAARLHRMAADRADPPGAVSR